MEQEDNINPSSSSSCKADRKTIEKNRRNQMKDLYLKLNSLVHHHQQHSKEILSLPDQLEEATNYIKKLQINLERVIQRREKLTRGENSGSRRSSIGRMERLGLPHIEIHSVDSVVEVVVITSLDYHFIFKDIIRMLHEEGAQVINASYNVIGDTIFHSIHSKVGECVTARLSERIKKCAGVGAT